MKIKDIPERTVRQIISENSLIVRHYSPALTKASIPSEYVGPNTITGNPNKLSSFAMTMAKSLKRCF